MDAKLYEQALQIARAYIDRIESVGHSVPDGTAEQAASLAANNIDLLTEPNDLKTTWTVEQYIGSALGL